jgi:uncharacterized membrane protein
MKRCRRVVKRFLGRRASERGATLVFTALSMVLLLWAGATGVDVGFTVYGSRQAQAMADTAALDLARYLSYADTLSSITAVQSYLNTKLANVLTDNGSTAQLTVVPGYYGSGKFTADGYTGASCKPVIAPPINQPGCNAIEVTANQSVPQIFFGGFNTLPGHAGNTTSSSVSGSSIATQTPYAGFSIGTYLASVSTQQSSILNSLLSPLGTSATLTAVGYEGLATADVSLAQLISASGGLLSATNIMTAQLTAAQWLSIYLQAVGTVDGTGTTAYSALQALSLSNSASTKIPLCQMVNVNTSGGLVNCTNSTISQQGLNAGVNILQLLTTEAELANGTNGINVTSDLNLTDPGLLNIGNVMLSTQVIEPAQVAYGPVGTTASDAQVQATLSMSLTLPILGTPLGTLTIPLSAATGVATLNTITCNDASLYSMALSASTGVASTGTTGNGITLTLLGIATTVASLTVTGVSNRGVTFTGPANPSGADIPPTAATQSAGTNPETVSGSLSPTITFGDDSGINAAVAALLSTGSVLADVLQPLLSSLGISVGGAQVAGLSANCGSVSLVQ